MKIEFHEAEVEGSKMAFFPYAPGSVSGALVESKGNSPSEKGPLIYPQRG